MFLKNRNISSKIKRSKVTDYVALIRVASFNGLLGFKNIGTLCTGENIGITHVFSCINMCRVPRMLFEHEADRSSVQTSSEGPGKC